MHYAGLVLTDVVSV